MSSTPQRMERFHASGLLVKHSSVLAAQSVDDVDELRAPPGTPPTSTTEVHHCWVRLPGAVEQGLVQAQSVDRADPFGVGLEQRFAEADHGARRRWKNAPDGQRSMRAPSSRSRIFNSTAWARVVPVDFDGGALEDDDEGVAALKIMDCG